MKTPTNNTRSRLWAWVLGVLAGIASTQAMAAITGSVHDFKASAWAGGEICVVCHTPHNATGAADGPLWDHATTTASFTVYSSPTGTLDSTPGQPSGASKLCLSCHDGTVAVDSFGGATGGTVLSGDAMLGTDLSDDHPISMAYDPVADTGLKATTTAVTIGSTVTKTGDIASLLIPSGTVECASCHDVHNTYTIASTPLLKVSNAGSGLCLTCHDK